MSERQLIVQLNPQAGCIGDLHRATLDTLSAISTLSFQGLLAAVSVPTLICFGDHERPPMQQASREMHEKITGSDFAIIENAGHLSMIDQPDAFTKLVRDHIGKAN